MISNAIEESMSIKIVVDATREDQNEYQNFVVASDQCNIF
jgi:hypothetical protein